ncbi:RecB-like exonuclease/helicase [Streptomyces phage RosaAsantewaa]|nr:RecB-like exonuclease/helicase [Streptomyces phage RosaAsantewaa]
MRFEFNRHPKLEGSHAFLSPSSNAWINYDDAKLESRLQTVTAAQRGTELHQLAHDLIRLGVKLPDTTQTLNAYVNDAIGFRMKPEQTLFFSLNCFGTADAIGFYPEQNLVRIHDLKTGVTKASMTQLYVYLALFCLEYRCRPFEVSGELRIYQNDDVAIEEADQDMVAHIMDKIVTSNKRIEALRMEGLA